MRSYTLLSVVLLTACGPAVETYFSYVSRCGVRVDSVVELNQANINAHFDETIEWYDAQFQKGDWCKDVAGFQFIIVKGDWACDSHPDVGCAGHTQTGYIWVNGERATTLHESFHARDLKDGSWVYYGTGKDGTHPYWDEKGYNQISLEFRRNAKTVFILPAQ